jgi:hypothetical protein
VLRVFQVRDGALREARIFSATKCMELGKSSTLGSTTPKKRKPVTETSPEEPEEELEEEFEKRLDLEGHDERLEGLEDSDLNFGACRAQRMTNLFLWFNIFSFCHGQQRNENADGFIERYCHGTNTVYASDTPGTINCVIITLRIVD